MEKRKSKSKLIKYFIVILAIVCSWVFSYSLVHGQGEYLDSPFNANVEFIYHIGDGPLDIIVSSPVEQLITNYGTNFDYYLSVHFFAVERAFFEQIYLRPDYNNYIPQRDNYYFVGWALEPNQTTHPARYEVDNWSVGRAVHLYPVFSSTQRTHSVTFNSSNSLYTGTGAPSTQIVEYGVKYSLRSSFVPTPVPTNSSLYFAYWSESQGNTYQGTYFNPDNFFFIYDTQFYPVFSEEYVTPPGQDVSAIRTLLFTLVDIPVYYLSQLMSFDLFGMNVFKAFTSIIALVVCFILLKKFW